MRVLITGTPGVGKTTICRGLAEALGARCIEVASLLAGKEFTLWDPTSQTYDILDINRARRLLQTELVGDYIIDTHVLELLENDDVERIFVLRKRPDILYEELARRGWPIKKILDNVWAEALDYILVRAKERWDQLVQLDVTYRRPDQTVELIRRCITNGECIHEDVDWLEYINENGFVELLERLSATYAPS